MRKSFKIILTTLLILLTFTLTACSKASKFEKVTIENGVIIDFDLEEYKDKLVIGLYKDGTLYTNFFELKDGEYQVITVLPKEDGKAVLLPEIADKGQVFAGWYGEKDGESIGRITSTSQLEGLSKVYVRHITLLDACLVALVCIIIVFSMLALLWGIVSLFRYFKPASDKKPQQQVVKPVIQPKKQLKMEDITDDDMMVAALVASIDYHSETKENVRVVSVKEIK